MRSIFIWPVDFLDFSKCISRPSQDRAIEGWVGRLLSGVSGNYADRAERNGTGVSTV